MDGLSRRAAGVLHAGFFLIGCATVLLGPLVPEMRGRWGATAGQVGWLFAAQFAVSSVTAVTAGFHLQRSLLAGYGLLAAGLALLAGGGWPLPVAAMSLVGAGLGFSIPATNLLVARAYPERRGAALSIVNLAWGLGATGCPLAFAAVRGRVDAVAVVWALAACCALTGVLLARELPAAQEQTGEGDGSSVVPLTRPLAAPPPHPGALQALLAGMLFLYIGVESTLGGWLVSLADAVGRERDALSMLIGSGYWAALLAGRAAAPLVLRRTSETRLHAAAIALAALGAGAVLAAGSRGGLALAAAIAGLGLAPIFPLIVSRLAAGGGATRGSGWVFAVGGFGGAVLPWLAGRLAAAGALRDGFWVPLAGLGLMALLLVAHRLGARAPAPLAVDR